MKIGIIGSGIAGLAVGREALLNGFEVSIFEKDKVLKGASVNNGAVLHSGARYLVDNKKVASLCFEENKKLKNIAPFATGKKLGLFLVEKDLDKKIEESFKKTAKDIGMPIRKVNLPELRKKIRSLNPAIKYGYETPDVIFNPFVLTQAYIEDILYRGGKIQFGTKVKKIKPVNNKVVIGYADSSGSIKSVEVDYLINCTGPSLAETAKLFKSNIEVDNIEGSMYVVPISVSDHFLTTCGVNFDGNAIVPIESASSIGSTWITDNISESRIIEDVKNNIKRIVNEDFPMTEKSAIRGLRTHFRSTDHTRSGIDYGIFSHAKEGIQNAYSVLPGKFALHRLVAEELLDSILEESKMKRLNRSDQVLMEAPTSNPKNIINYIL